MRALSATFLGLLAPVAAGAGVELTVAAGYRGGETGFPIEARPRPAINCVTTPCILADATAEADDPSLSLILDVPISRRWMVEALLTEQDGDLGLRSAIGPVELEPESFEATTVQVGLLRHWGEGRLRPFAAGALGVTRFESSAMAYERPFFAGIAARPVDDEVLSGSLAGGLKAGLGRHLAVRLEGRAYWHDLPERLGGVMRQTEASFGLTYRW